MRLYLKPYANCVFLNIFYGKRNKQMHLKKAVIPVLKFIAD